MSVAPVSCEFEASTIFNAPRAIKVAWAMLLGKKLWMVITGGKITSGFDRLLWRRWCVWIIFWKNYPVFSSTKMIHLLCSHIIKNVCDRRPKKNWFFGTFSSGGGNHTFLIATSHFSSLTMKDDTFWNLIDAISISYYTKFSLGLFNVHNNRWKPLLIVQFISVQVCNDSGESFFGAFNPHSDSPIRMRPKKMDEKKEIL